VLFDTLLKQVELDELLAILGHEMGHWKLWHTIQGFIIGQIYTFAIFLAFSFFQNSYDLFRSFGFSYSADRPVPVFVGLMLFAQTFWMPVEKTLGLIMNYNSRTNEFAADKYSKDLGMADALSRGLVKISSENLGNLVPDRLYSLYHFSHPPLVERLQALGGLKHKTQ
jgi:STE24 endopeptidase